MPLVPSLTKKGIVARVTEQGVVAKVAGQGIVAKVDETLNEKLPPVIVTTLDSIDAPNDPGEVTLGFTFSDADGTVEKIELFQRFDLGTAVSIQVFEPPDPSPFQHQVTALSDGDYLWFAVATDDNGLSTQSNIISVTVGLGVVTFDVGGDKTFVDGEGVPGFASIIKAYRGGAGTIEQLSGVGKVVTAVTADYGFFAAQNSMGTGTWKVFWDWAYTPAFAANNFQTVAILNTLHTTSFQPDSSDNIVQYVIDRFNGSSANVRMQYVNTSGVATSLFTISGGLPFGQLITFSFEKDATNFIFTFDEGQILGTKVVKIIAQASVIAGRPNAFFLAIDPYNAGFTHHATSKIDNIGGLI